MPGSSSLHDDRSSCGTLAPFAAVVVAAAESSDASIVNGLDGRRCMDLKHKQPTSNGPYLRWKGSTIEKKMS
jgi:hypothetical protein